MHNPVRNTSREPDPLANTLPPLIVADLDGTLLHDAEVFEDRDISERSIRAIERAHDAGSRFVIATARPVSTGLRFAEQLPVDAVIYLNGALIDFDPAHSNFDTLTSGAVPNDGSLIKIGFPSRRACEVCLDLLSAIPELRIGIVMDDVRYTNFDISVYWKTQTFRYTDFHDVPDGVADKITIFPEPDQWDLLHPLIPDDFEISVSEGVMWMLMNPEANKQHAMRFVCDRFDIPAEQTVAFGDDLIDITMMQTAGRGIAVSNANPAVLAIADEVCPPNNEDGVAQWIESRLQ
ncbi:HAD family hydrolase [Bifidobacterium scaligerum]|uniref:HAD family hydrolase n=1 Tax=Bifidobacterium scaligerum TaxID=2052656 RepID=A0A2M9HTR1_9BIFI|nr:HAD family hydrolase [Bifidobacterium scaligerum]PJM80186.1 HAD family hydrolase [Bifidobacterium scaligerum]